MTLDESEPGPEGVVVPALNDMVSAPCIRADLSATQRLSTAGPARDRSEGAKMRLVASPETWSCGRNDGKRAQCSM
ncbi:hypothetical protein [Sinorhizobium saheli]|uniref:Uncharacterized protein n=1 Tax=Sinorhizobium saheli TaxID=36856 RepID=A0A178Y9L6_SINSA|nr:hypothetical protein [Sinorhizobium saheli]MQW86140.1 hypothetical protein [Sinorhizobium saheli]OAP44137.1 hypothetical protein ATB98_00220 [Sinorhizobium saheli]